MEKLDLKDRKILYYLDIDSRQSFAQIGKKVGLHKDSIGLRVKKLQEKGIIINFFTYIDFSKLGYNVYRYYFLFQYANPKKRIEIINYFADNKYTIFSHTLEGQYDLSVYMAVKDVNDFYHIWDDAFRKYNKYFSKRAFSVWCSEKLYPYTFLIDENLTERNDFENVVECGGKTNLKINDIDLEILKLMAIDARIPTIELANKLKISTQTINSRVKNLIKSGVICGFKVKLDLLKLNYKLCRLDINLNENVKKQPIIDFLSKNPHLRCIYGSIGDAADIEIEIILRDLNQIHELMETISNIFPNFIKEYKYHIALTRHKNMYIPDI